MKSILFSFLSALLFSSSLALAQDPVPAFYAESIRKGPVKITEDEFDVKLTLDNPIYSQRLRDSAGLERFELAITPNRPEGGATNQITSWEMNVRDLRNPVYGNLLQFDRELCEAPRDNLYWLNPVSSSPVPIRAERIIKIQAFYFVARVTDFRVTPGTPYLEFMTVHLQLTNHDPRQQRNADTQKATNH
jgi:hypothetical protein